MSEHRIQFTVFGTPRPKGSTTPFFHKTTKQIITRPASRGLQAWETAIRAAAQEQAKQGVFFTDAVSLTVHFTFERPASVSVKKRACMTTAPDCSKLVRGVEDAMTGVLYQDDSLITKITATKVYGPTGYPSRADIVLEGAVETSHDTVQSSDLFDRKDAHA